MSRLSTCLTFRQKNRISISIVFILFVLNISAQSFPDTISIPEVKVFGKIRKIESTLNIIQIDTLALKMMQNQSISELLSSFSPVFIKSFGRGSVATASFRGTASTHTHIYWNDIKLNSSMRGDYDFSLFPVYFIDDINIQHGGSSIISGSGSLGGSILVNNKPVWTESLSISFVQNIESFSTFKEYLNVGFMKNNWYFKSRLYSDISKNNFPFYNYGILPMFETSQKDASYNKKGLLQEIYRRNNKKTYSVKLWINHSYRNLPQLMSFEGSARVENQTDINYNSVFSVKHNGEKLKYENLTGLSKRKLNYLRISPESNFVNFDSRSSENNFNNKLKLDLEISEKTNLHSNINFELQNVEVDDLITGSGYNKTRYLFSWLNALNYQANDKLSLAIIIRNELYNNDIIRAIPLLGIKYYLDNRKISVMKINAGRNFNQPSLNDLYWKPGGNAELKPEDGITSDISYIYSKTSDKNKFDLSTSLYFSLIDNWIVWQPSKSGAYFWEASNLRKVFARGSEIQVSYYRNVANSINYSLSGNYSLSASSNIDAVESVDESRGKQLIYIPKHKANFAGEVNFLQYFMKINVPFTGKRYTTSNNVESDYEKVLSSYFLVNLTAGKKFFINKYAFDFSFNVENVLNTDYMAILWRPMPGRYYSASLQFRYNKK